MIENISRKFLKVLEMRDLWIFKIAYILALQGLQTYFIEVGGVSVNGKREHRRTKTEDTTVDDPF